MQRDVPREDRENGVCKAHRQRVRVPRAVPRRQERVLREHRQRERVLRGSRQQAYVPRVGIPCRHGRLRCGDRRQHPAVRIWFLRNRERRQYSPRLLRIRRYRARLSAVLRRFRYKRKECRK